MLPLFRFKQKNVAHLSVGPNKYVYSNQFCFYFRTRGLRSKSGKKPALPPYFTVDDIRFYRRKQSKYLWNKNMLKTLHKMCFR